MTSRQRPLTFELLQQLAIVAAIPLLVTIAFFVWQLYPQLKQNVAAEQQVFAGLVAERSEAFLRTAEQQVQFFVPYLQEVTPEQTGQQLSRFVHSNHYFDSVYLLDYRGVVLEVSKREADAALTSTMYRGTDMSKSPLLRIENDVASASWSDVFLSVITGRLSIAYRVPLGDDTLIAELAIDRLPHLSQRLSEQGQLVMILDHHGQLIAHPDVALSQQRIHLGHLPFFREPMQTPVKSGEFQFEEQSYFGSMIKMSGPNWFVVVAQEESQFMAGLYHTLQLWLTSIIMIVLLAMIIAYRRARQFSKRFERLNAQARSVARGQYQQDSSGIRILEFAELAASLDEMANAIQQREFTLQTKEQQLRDTLESTPNVAVQWYDAGGHVLYWNEASEFIFGFTGAEAIGHRLNDLIFAPRPTAEFNILLQKIACGEASNREFELPFHHKDGHEGSLRGALFRIPGADEQDIYVCMATDVTKQREAEANIRELNAELEQRVADRTRALSITNRELEATLGTLQETMEQLVQSEKMAALGSLVAGVAHELNTPIGNAMMAASSLEDFTRSIDNAFRDGQMTRSSLEQFLNDARTATGISSRNLERASELISSFKQVAVDQSSSQRREFSAAELVHEILLTLHPQTKKSPVTISVDIAEDIVLDSFPGPFGQVISNLVMNAFVHAFAEEEAGEIVVSGTSRDALLILEVRDNGAGIPDEQTNRIFDPFYTTRLGQGGSGLGLHIVHNLVSDLLGGRIAVTSKLGEGTVFTIEMPLSAPAAENTPSAAHKSGGNEASDNASSFRPH